VFIDEHPDPLELLTIADVMALSKLSRASVYREIDAGRLRVVKLGRSIRIPRAEFERWIASSMEPAA
jgi:excisionase family DNA binding protein